MQATPMITFADGNQMPQLGFGLWQIPDDEATAATAEALRVGYRSLDSAHIYKNEVGVGRALAQSQIAREQVFVTTKLWNSDQGADATQRAFDASLSKLGLDYVDLYLIHWPAPHRDLYVQSWKELIAIKKSGRAKSIGVSNFSIPHLQRLIDETEEVPVVNQIELHPRFVQRELRAFHAKHGIVTEAWSPLGQGQLIADPVVAEVATKHGKTPAQVLLRWHLDCGIVAIPK